MQRGHSEEALELLARARSLGTEDHHRCRFDTWRAEILARTGRPAEAAEIYKSLVSSSSSAPQVALDAAETLLDNNHRSHARPFLAQARELARSAGVRWVEDRVKALHQTRP